MLEVEDLSFAYGSIKVLWNISFQVPDIDVTSIIGSNCAGKSTLLGLVAGTLFPSNGRIVIDGVDITSEPAYERVNRGISLVPEGRRLFPHLTVEENLEAGAFTPRARAKVRENLEIISQLFPILKERRRQVAHTLSGGEQQMLAIARGLMSMPKLLMLDEPSLGLGPRIVSKIFDVVDDVRNVGIGVLLVAQDIYDALRICSTAYVLENGRIVMKGSGKELLEDRHVRKAYLGI
jgi:branched-chain amino acid transport system ATP-binding protein